MNESFDPYLKWLGIRDPERPPNHYRLLGIDFLESDPDVIATAADRQMAHVRRYQSGSHAPASQDLLNELAVAKLLLLSPEKKAAYDRTLQQTAPRESGKDVRVAGWAIITVVALGILALSVVFAKRDTGEPTIEIADTIDETAQAEVAVNDEPPVQKDDADHQEDDADHQTYDHGSAQPMLPAVPLDSPQDGSHVEGEDAGTPVSDGQTPPSTHELPPWESEIVEIRPVLFVGLPAIDVHEGLFVDVVLKRTGQHALRGRFDDGLAGPDSRVRVHAPVESGNEVRGRILTSRHHDVAGLHRVLGNAREV